MEDEYWRKYVPSADTAIPSYLPSDTSILSSHSLWPSRNHVRSSSDLLPNDILASRPGSYGVDDIIGVGVRPEPGFSRYMAGTSKNSYLSASEDPYLAGRRDVLRDNGPGISDIVNERPNSLRKPNGLTAGSRKSNVLFVDALPSDCTRREVSHLFRPFPGFKEIKLVHKEPRNGADKAIVLCFVEFLDSNHASTALEALQDYKFDHKKPDSPALRIHFAHFPFQLPHDREEQGYARYPFQPPSDREEQGLTRFPPSDREEQGLTRFPLQPLPDREEQSRAHFPSQRSPDREEHALAITRERELANHDEEPMSGKRKFQGSPRSSKKGKVSESSLKKCVKCKKKHPGECFADRDACYNCGKTGHLMRDCKKKRTCYGCGGSDHIVADCPNPNMKRRSKGGLASVKNEGPPKA
uniref:nuclear speckle RNA-binding protein B-like isoform X2 n=1 Tax=Erigeron canadensis TaxID=72917 RepID=UPI001CB97D1A|nr:nuclear speckle RNA-binding protein B-like isoform X2 [Erigeron canadensis]